MNELLQVMFITAHVACSYIYIYMPITSIYIYIYIYHCKKRKVVLIQFGYLSFHLFACIVKHSGIPLPALDSKQIKNLNWLSRTLANVMGEYLANDIVQSCGKGMELR